MNDGNQEIPAAENSMRRARRALEEQLAAFSANSDAAHAAPPTFEPPANASVANFPPPVAVPPVAPTAQYSAPPAAPAAQYSAPTAAPVNYDAPTAPEAPTAVFDLDAPVTRQAPPILHNPKAALTGANPDLIAALQHVVDNNASDLHLTAEAAPTIRIDGGLRPIEDSVIWDAARVEGALRSIMTESQRSQFDAALEFDFAYTIPSESRFRVNIYQQRGAMGAAFRLIPTEIKQLKDLGVPETVSQFASLARGLVLVTGPTGSGKSTTLAALIDLVNRSRADHIMTVEDPIEFLHNNHRSLVNQREVGNDTHSFAAALKHVLRQDPDVILVGELRDLETISVALTAAETGHLVFATLHTQDAAQTIDRVIDVYPPHQQGQVRAQLAATLQGVVCQTLVKKASGSGRVVATEVLVATPAINNLIREGKTYQIHSSMQAGREQGMFTMDQHLAELVNTGQITSRAAYEKCHDDDTLKRLIHRQETPDGRGMSGGIDFGDSFSVKA